LKKIFKTNAIIFITLCVILFQGIAIGKEVNEVALEARGMQLLFDQNGKIKVKSAGHETSWFPSAFKIYEEKEINSVLELPQPFEVIRNEDKLIYKFEHPSGVIIIQEFWEQEGYISAKITLKNTKPEQKWVRVAAQLPLIFEDNTIDYWDGHTLKKQFSGRGENTQLLNVFPAAAVFDQVNGMAVGIEVYQIFSHIENNLVYSESNKVLSYGVKMVLNEGASESAEFIYYTFKPDYGYLNAIDSYYSFYPEAFKPNSNINPRVVESIGAHRATIFGNEHREIYRKLNGKMTWWYAPYKKSGQFWMHDKEEFERELPNQDKIPNKYKAPMEEFRDNELRIGESTFFDGISPLYYILNWCEEDLANRKYSDAILKNNDGKPLIKYGWVKPYMDDLCMWWWGNTFAEDTKRDIQMIVDEVMVDGFSLDCAAGKMKARNQTGFDEVPGVAYDTVGVYSEESVSVAKMMDFIHSLEKDGTTMATFANFNGSFPYYSAVRADTTLIERDITQFVLMVDELAPQRYLLGTKPQRIYSLIIREPIGKLFPWKTMSAEDIRRLYQVFWDKAMLVAYKTGTYPSTDFFCGYPRVARKTIELTSVISAGWEPVPAFKTNQDIWDARYGEGLETFLFIGNPQVRPLEIDARIDNEYIGDGTYLFSAFDNQKVVNEIIDGRTCINLSLDPNEYVILKTLAKVDIDEDMHAYLQEIGDKSKMKVCITLEVKENKAAMISVKVPDEGTVYSVTVNDQPVVFQQKQGSVSFVAELFSTNNSIVVFWHSNILLSSANEIKEFPFVKYNFQPNCTIVVPNDAEVWDETSAERLCSYFRYYYKEVFEREVYLPIKNVSDPNINGLRVILEHDPNSSGSIQLVDGNLVVSGSDSFLRYQLVEQLMTLLDEQYSYFGVIGINTWYPTDPDTVQMREKAGLDSGKIMD
jgi:hypothetical protein